MFTLKEAKKRADFLTRIHNEQWVIFLVPNGAPINQYPLNIYNKGKYHCCKLSEVEEYKKGGAVFPQLNAK